MRNRGFWTVTTMLQILSVVAFNPTRGNAQGVPALRSSGNTVLPAIARPDLSIDGAASIRASGPAGPQTGRLIVIGFVGGFVKRDDARHPEIQLAEGLRQRYGSNIYAQVYGNHNREAAHRQILHWLDANGDGELTPDEKRKARIVLYGHSWGASETVALARELSHRNIPVLLTIQVDSIGKPGQHDRVIPPNVANAVNFYQPDGLFHGCSEITAENPRRTRILGNFRMTYTDQPVRSGGSSWLARLFMKSHIQIEDDPRIWQQAADLIDEQFAQAVATNGPQAPND